MMCLAQLSLIILLIWTTGATAEKAQDAWERRDAKRIEQTKVEARAVLAIILRDDNIKATPCRFDSQWSQTPVSAYIAQSYLGSSLNADVIASHLPVNPNDLIDADGAMRGSFCPDKEASILWRQMEADFRSGFIPGEQDLYEGKPNGPRRVRLWQIKFAVPVFDRTFTTAAVVVSLTGTMMWRTDAENARANPRMFDEAGYLRSGEPSGASRTYVYRKQDRRWRRVYSNEDSTIN